MNATRPTKGEAMNVTAKPGEEVYTAAEVAERLKVRRETVYGWCGSGELKHVRIGRTVRIRVSDLEAFLDAHTEGE